MKNFERFPKKFAAVALVGGIALTGCANSHDEIKSCPEGYSNAVVAGGKQGEVMRAFGNMYAQLEMKVSEKGSLPPDQEYTNAKLALDAGKSSFWDNDIDFNEAGEIFCKTSENAVAISPAAMTWIGYVQAAGIEVSPTEYTTPAS